MALLRTYFALGRVVYAQGIEDSLVSALPLVNPGRTICSRDTVATFLHGLYTRIGGRPWAEGDVVYGVRLGAAVVRRGGCRAGFTHGWEGRGASLESCSAVGGGALNLCTVSVFLNS